MYSPSTSLRSDELAALFTSVNNQKYHFSFPALSAQLLPDTFRPSPAIYKCLVMGAQRINWELVIVNFTADKPTNNPTIYRHAAIQDKH